MKCVICGSDYWRGYYGPSEDCICRENAGWCDTPWQHDGWRGVVNWARYRVLFGLVWLAARLDGAYWSLRRT
jgi:hypothetical protein